MSIIKSFTLKEADLCVKCAAVMPIGTEVTWLRDSERKGYLHPTCIAKDTILALTRVKVQDAASQLGYSWKRAGEAPALPDFNKHKPVQATALPDINGADSILINTIAKALLPALGKMVAESRGPRIIIQVFVPKVGDEMPALETLGNELFKLGSVREV